MNKQLCRPGSGLYSRRYQSGGYSQGTVHNVEYPWALSKMLAAWYLSKC
jgi:hypothetical protein